jgi:hypothetical protein
MPRSCSPSPSLSHFFGDGGGQKRPVLPALDPVREPLTHGRLLQKQMLGLAHFEIGGAGDRRARVHQIGRVELLGAVLALVAAGLVVAAIGAGSLDIAVGQEAAVLGRIDLPGRDLLDQPVLPELLRQMLGQRLVLLGRGAAEPVEGKPEALPQPLLHRVHLGAVLGHGLAGLGGGEFGGRAVLVGGADIEHLMAAGAHEAGVGAAGQHRADQIAQMLDAVDVRQGGGDQDPGHRALLAGTRRCLADCPGAGERGLTSRADASSCRGTFVVDRRPPWTCCSQALLAARSRWFALSAAGAQAARAARRPALRAARRSLWSRPSPPSRRRPNSTPSSRTLAPRGAFLRGAEGRTPQGLARSAGNARA